MKALTIHQPWASAIVDGPKRVENRKFRPRQELPMDIAIHAGLHSPDEQTIFDVQRLWLRCPEHAKDFQKGAVLGVATIISIMDEAEAKGWLRHRLWTVGPLCWELDNVRRLLRPVPCKGRLSLWTLPDDVEAKVLEQLR